jgi:hypothetical protein
MDDNHPAPNGWLIMSRESMISKMARSGAVLRHLAFVLAGRNDLADLEEEIACSPAI